MGILIRPIVTEKASSASELENRYSFEVKTTANKVQIKKAVEDFYGVNVEKVRTLIYKPKHKTRIQYKQRRRSFLWTKNRICS